MVKIFHLRFSGFWKCEVVVVVIGVVEVKGIIEVKGEIEKVVVVKLAIFRHLPDRLLKTRPLQREGQV